MTVKGTGKKKKLLRKYILWKQKRDLEIIGSIN